MNTQRISEMSGKEINNTLEAVKDHPAITALLSLGVSWFTLHAAPGQKATSGKIAAQLQEGAEQYAESKLAHPNESAKESGEMIARKSHPHWKEFPATQMNIL
jgi:hypothetical protein